MEILVAATVVLAILLVLVLGTRSFRATPRAPGAADLQGAVGPDGRLVVVIDVRGVDPSALATRRLIDDVASRALAASPKATVVEVRDADDRVLGERRREQPREVAIPPELYEPHARRRREPDVVRGTERAPASVEPNTEIDESLTAGGPHKALADRLEIPADVRQRLADPDDVVELVAAIIEASGRRAAVDGDVVRVSDEAVVIIRAPIGDPVPPEALNHAYRRFADSGASRGVVVTPGYMDPRDVRRREAFAPELQHAGPAGIQRMADAASLGADPVPFAAGPPMSVGSR